MTDYILVPMQLDVMVLAKQASLATPFLRFQMDYKKLANYQTPEPKPFEGASLTQPSPGIYLSWTLPKALRNSIAQSDGTDEFPLVPNRFLVTRVQSGVDPSTAIKAWIIESDYIDTANATSPFVNPFAPNTNGIPVPTKIGRSLLFEDLDSIASANPSSFLTAVGPGNTTFSVFSPGVDNVFSFYDDVVGIDVATFSYYVIGWYLNPTDDPLQDTTWSPNSNTSEAGSYMNSLFDWIVYSNDANIPTNMLVHTLVSDIPWNRDDSSTIPETYPQPETIAETVKVGFGNTSTDALASIVGNASDANARTDADFLSAFQYNALDKYDQASSATQLNIEVREHWYGSSSGGTFWSVLPVEPDQSTALAAPPAAQITASQKIALDNLNSTQQELDKQDRILQSMQHILYTLWWKYEWQTRNTILVDPDFASWLNDQLYLQVNGDENYSTWYIDQVRDQQQKVADLTDSIKKAKDTLESLLDSTTQRIQDTNASPYYYANDPVLLVTGLGKATNFDPTGNVLCRFVRQTIDSLTVNGISYGIDENASQNVVADIPKLSDPHQLLPTGSQELNIENFFLSPDLFSQNVFGNTDEVDAVKEAINALPLPAADQRFPPSEYARNYWIQPWVPLLLDWKITFFKEPAYTCNQVVSTSIFNQEYWKFDGTDYIWTGTTEADDQNYNEIDSAQMELIGRTFVAPYVPSSLANQIQTLNQSLAHFEKKSHKLSKKYEENRQETQDLDILSQRLSGLMAKMVQRNYSSNVPPTDDILTALGDSYQGYSQPFPGEHSSYADTPWGFTPMRGSFFVIDRLSIIDIFGRTVDLMQANYSQAPHKIFQPGEPQQEDYFYPFADAELKASTTIEPYQGIEAASSPTERMLKLAPRFIQDAKLEFNLTSNNDKNENVEISVSNPVCGWLLSNHLNRSLAVYDSDGKALGEMYLSLHDEHLYEPIWQPDPTRGDAPQSVEEIENMYMRELLLDLMNRKDNGQSFNDFIQAIDQTLWTIDSHNPSDNDAELSVLVGRPLALVRSSLALKLRGLAYTNQDWWNTFDVSSNNLPSPYEPAPLADVNGGVFDYTWSVRLGSQELNDDGLIGYYLDDPNDSTQSFHYFNCVALPGTVSSNYLKKIAPGNFIDLKFTDDSATELDPKNQQIAYATLLIDPRGCCHAFSGILPVYTKLIPNQYIQPALTALWYLFRAGPIITPPEEASLPQPAEDQGLWTWFDKTIQDPIPIAPKATKVRFMTPPPLVKQGWLKFIPDINDIKTQERS